MGMLEALSQQCALELTFNSDELPQRPQARPWPLMLSALATLRVLGGPHIFLAFTQMEEPKLLWDRGVLNAPFSGRLLAEPFHIGGSEREDLRQLWRALHSGPNAKPVQVALRRWSTAADRVEEEDKLIDYWVGLEALFIPDAKQELRLRASLRGAAFLGQQPEERGRTFEVLRDSYDWRSAIVHGSTPDRKVQRRSSLTDVVATTGTYLRSSLLAFLRADEALDPEDFERRLFAPNLVQEPSTSPPIQDA
jgi:hypothetical protein